ncbi:hypothetical protein [Bacillus sp. FJAT-49736]|uniref:hypothetical protein n=1 Tax=Bacillus sp. FJAT-49736 TaxID=2833582 RepID=UPI001BC93EA7|nr:hypothetical protein [Bacillus sp. FJAT-49736]MBS4173504.1 hypothetical protein [Bacillus sp. FJAT-49736]
MKFEKGQLVYNGHTGDKLYEVIGYNAGNGIILLPVGLEDKYGNRIVVHSDRWIWIYAKKD